MANHARSRSTVSPMVAFLTLAGTKVKQHFALTTILLAAVSSFSQQQPQTPSSQPTESSEQTSSENTSVTIPPGTQIPLVLTHPVQSRMVHHGDDIYAQTTAPITVGSEVAIPAGTFVQGKIDKFGRNGSRGEMYLQSMSLIFPDGYTAPIAGPVTLESNEGYALKDPGGRRGGWAFALIPAGLGAGALIGHLVNSKPTTITNTLPPGCVGPPPGCLTSSLTEPGSSVKDTIIGMGIGGMVGGVASFAVLASSRHFYLDVGSPMAMSLQQPLTLKEGEVEAAVRQAEQHPTPEQPIAQRPRVYVPPPDNDPGTCYTPGTPGTPDTVIPGTPATPDSPGTPPTMIPGIPPTPPIPHPCP
jgi:hypothetical protein